VCVIIICALKPELTLNNLPQKLHSKGLSSRCDFICWNKVLLMLNPFWQYSQMYCLAIALLCHWRVCLFSSLCVGYPFPHSQMKSLMRDSPVCVLECRFKCVEVENLLWHLSYLQTNGFSPVCMRICLTRSPCLEKHFWHVTAREPVHFQLPALTGLSCCTSVPNNKDIKLPSSHSCILQRT